MMTVWVLFEDFKEEAQTYYTIYLLLPTVYGMFKLSPVPSLTLSLLKIHFIIIIILWTSDHAVQCKPISIHIILIQNPRAGLLDPPDPPQLHLFHRAAPIRATQNLELVREII